MKTVTRKIEKSYWPTYNKIKENIYIKIEEKLTKVAEIAEGILQIIYEKIRNTQ